jgi:transposase
MAILPQPQLFCWEEIEGLGELERLSMVLAHMPDEQLMQILECERGQGRDDYPIRGMWNALLAGIVYQHCSVESLLRELRRNGQLRMVCGFKKVPTSSAFSRFLSKLLDLEKEVTEIFERLVKELIELLPDFGENLSIDGKAISTHAKAHKKSEPDDGRRDNDADYGVKTYRGQNEDGTKWEKVKTWFGYNLHLIVDSKYELPVMFSVSKASAAEAPEAHRLLKQMEQNEPTLLERCKYFTADRGYDDLKLILKLRDRYNIKPLIDIRNMWKDGAETRLLTGQSNVVYDYRGNVSCYCPQSGTPRQMAFGGFEQDRQTLKYRCPAHHYGISCAGQEQCPVNKAIRIPLEEAPRIFTPVARSSYKWKELYKMRTATERVNSRLDVSFGFERHFIRGQKKMQLRVGLALCVMLAMAVGRIKEKQPDKMRSLVA